MSLSVIFGTTTDDPITVNKDFSTAFTTDLNPLEAVDEINPYFELKYNAQYFTNQINYAYISTFKRYYFVKKILLPSNMMGLQLNVDVLKSNESDIMDTSCIIVRTGGLSKPTYTQDSKLPIEQGRQNIRVFPFDANSPHGVKDGTTGEYVTGTHLVIQTI